MGALGVALLWAFISFFKLIGAYGKWYSWKHNAALCPAMIVEILDRTENYKKGVTRCRYQLAVDYRGDEASKTYPLAVFEKNVHTGSGAEPAVGQELQVLYHPYLKTCQDAVELKSAVRSSLGGLIASVVIIVIIFLIVGALD